MKVYPAVCSLCSALVLNSQGYSVLSSSVFPFSLWSCALRIYFLGKGRCFRKLNSDSLWVISIMWGEISVGGKQLPNESLEILYILNVICYPASFKTFKSLWFGTSLVAQWLRIHLPMQGTQVWSLVWEDPTCCRATKPVRHNCWARAP